jgi:hypothetical protein
LLAPEEVERLRAIETESQFVGLTHLSLGMWLRNNWDLWGRLSAYFNERGVHHPDTMSGIVFTSYYRHLRGEPLRLDKQLAASREAAPD